MKQTFMMAAALVLAFSASAQITRGTVGNGNYVDYSGETQSNVPGLDFNNDGTHEYALSAGYNDDGQAVDNGALNFVWSEGGNSVATISSDEWDKMKSLTVGTQVGPSSGWYAQGDAYVSVANTEMYVGLRFKLGNTVHYGWARVTIATGGAEGYGYTATWQEIYYQATANTTIAVGDRTSVGIVNATPETLKITTTGLDVTINSDRQGTVQLFDVAGRCVDSQECNGNCTLKAPSTGVYVVRTATASRKVIVK